MRGIVNMKLGGREVALLPSFEVADAFEERHGSLMAHLEALTQGRATLNPRAFLVWKAACAGDPAVEWQIGTIKERMFDRGYWNEDIVILEAELIERLLYTPEQYLEKKELRAKEAERMRDFLTVG